MKGFLKPTKAKIIVAFIMLPFLFFIVSFFLAFTGLSITDLGLPCMGTKEPLPFMAQGATYYTEWLYAWDRQFRGFHCGPNSQLEVIFATIISSINVILFLSICYVLSCTLIFLINLGKKRTHVKK